MITFNFTRFLGGAATAVALSIAVSSSALAHGAGMGSGHVGGEFGHVTSTNVIGNGTNKPDSAIMMRAASASAISVTSIRQRSASTNKRNLADRVIDIRGEDHGIGIKNVTMNEAHFAGHFPDKTPARFYSLRRNPSRPS
jgi:hypothetical protein